jgi:hypothetical protein
VIASRRLRVAFVIAAAAFPAAAAGAAQADIGPNPDPSTITEWAPCEPGATGPGTGVTVVVDFNALGDHDILVRCAPTDPLLAPPSGISALQRAGFDIAGTHDYGLSFICRIQGLPPVSGPDAQPCQRAAPSNAYWSYWHADGGGIWSYSGSGAGGYFPQPGTVEGWSFSTSEGATIAPRVVPPGDAPPFVMPEPQSDVAAVSARLRTWLLPFPLRVDGDAVPGDTAVSATAVTSWAASGEPLDALAPQLAPYHDADAIARAIGSGRPLTAQLYRAQPGDLTKMGLALIAQGIDPTHLQSGQDLRAELLSELQPDGRVPSIVRADPHGGPDTVDDGAPALSLQARAIAFLALTGTVPSAAVTFLDNMVDAGAFTGPGYDPSDAARAIDLLATARANGATGLDRAIDAGVAALLASQNADGSVNVTSYPTPIKDTTLPAALVARALFVTGHPADGALSRGYVTRFALTPAEALYTGDGRPDVGALLPSADALRGAMAKGITLPYAKFYAYTTDIQSLPALGRDPAAVLRPVPPPGTEDPGPGDDPGTTTTVPVAAAPGPALARTPVIEQGRPVPRARLAVTLAGRVPRAAALARSGVLKVRITAPGAGTLTVAASVSRAVARSLHLRSATVGSAKARLTVTGTHTLSVRMTAAIRRVLAKTHKTITFTITVHGPSGTAHLTLGVRR